MTWPLITGVLLCALWAGQEIASGSRLPFLVAFGVLAGAVLVKNPIWGFYLTYPLFFLVPYEALRFDFPFFDSPVEAIALLTLGIALARFVVQRRPLPTGLPYRPLAACAGVLAVFTVIGHGPDTGWYLYRFVQGLWPLYLAILLVETPRQARNVLIALFVSVVSFVFRYLPTLLSISSNAPQAEAPFVLARTMTGSWQIYQAIALVLIPLFSLAMFGRQPRLRYLYGAAVVAGAFTVVGGTYLGAMLTFAMGITIVLLLGTRLGWAQWRISAIVLVVAVVAVTCLSPPGRFLLNRLLNPWDDPNVSLRLRFIYIEGVQAFLESPLVGWGGYLRTYVTPGGHWLDGHSSFIPAAYQFGLVFIVPLFLVFRQVGQNYRWLLAQPLSHTERVLLVGTLAAFVTYLTFGIFAMTLFEASQDSVIWLFTGLTVVWRNWLSQGSQSRIVA